MDTTLKTCDRKMSDVTPSKRPRSHNDDTKLLRLKSKRRKLKDTQKNMTLEQPSGRTGDDQTKRKRRIIMPSKPEEISANWKKLAPLLPKPKPKPVRSGTSDKLNSPGKSDEQDIWFDGVDEILLEKPLTKAESNPLSLVKEHAFSGMTKIVAIDCEMVGVGPVGKESSLARVSIVNRFGQCVYDKFVTPSEPVTDYRTQFSGIRPQDLQNKGVDFKTVQKEVSDILKGRTLVGHAVHNDLQVLFLDHPHKRIRDTSRYKFFRKMFGGKSPSLKKLTEKLLGVQIQDGEHDSVQDARAAIRLYTMYRQQWENELKSKQRTRKQQSEEKQQKP